VIFATLELSFTTEVGGMVVDFLVPPCSLLLFSASKCCWP